MNHRRLYAYSLFLLVSLIWGWAGPVIKNTLTYMPPLVFLTYRLAISTVVAIIYFAMVKPHISHSPKEQAVIVLHGILTVPLALGLLFYAFEKTTSLTGTVISSVQPIILVLGGMLFFRDHITRLEKIGFLIALAGTLVIVFEPVIFGKSVMVGSVEGNILVLANVLFDTLAAILAKALMRGRTDPYALAQIGFIIGFIIIGPLTIMKYPLDTVISTILHAPLIAHAGVWFMALISGSLAYGLRNRGLRSIELSETAVFGYLMPVFAAPLSVFWLGEKITVPFLAASGIIVAGVAMAEYKRRTKPAAVSVSHVRRRKLRKRR